MSILEDFEEISFDNSFSHTKLIEKNSLKEKRHKLRLRFNQIKLNPDTYDSEGLLKQIKGPKLYLSKSPPVVDRLLFSYQLSQNKKKFLLQKKECEEKQACTFRPNTYSSKKNNRFKENRNSGKNTGIMRQKKVTQNDDLRKESSRADFSTIASESLLKNL